MSSQQRYRLRNPANGREIVLEAEPGRSTSTARPASALEVVGKVLPLAPSQLAAAVGGREPPLLPLVRPARPEGPQRLPHLRPAHGAARIARGGSLRASALALALALLLGAVTLAACGGGSSASDAVPKSTPEITPPNDTSAEKAAAQTTSTSTTSTSKTTTTKGESSANESGGNEATEEPTSGGSSSGASEESKEATPSGGSSAEKEKESAAGASPSGGASAP